MDSRPEDVKEDAIDYISGELLKAPDLPWEDEYLVAFQYYEDECRYTTPDIPSLARCLSYMARCVQATKRFFDRLPRLAAVEQIPASV